MGAIFIKGGGSAGSKNELAWSNDSPAAITAGTTISMDLAGYSYVAIGMMYNYKGTDPEPDMYAIIPVGSTGRAWCNSSTSNGNHFYRDITVAETGITLTSSNAGSNPNNYAIPKVVYGIADIDGWNS